jgi:peptidoglycan/xylan/chitin deacetylase (PgdA/CDA1 family)
MSKKKRQTHRKLKHILVSVAILGFFIIPLYITGLFLVNALGTHDSRKVIDIPVFDDGWESVYTKALPILQQDGIHTTQYIITGTFDNPSYLSLAQIKTLHSAGHDIGAHTVDHLDLTTLDDTSLTYQLSESQKVLSQYFGPIRDFTSPYGSYNAHTLDMIGRYYRSQKNAEGDPAANELEAINIKSSFKALNFKSYSVRNTTTTKDIQKLLKAAQDNNGWLVLTYHQIDDTDETFSVTPNAFKQQMQLISQSKIRSATIGQVMDVLVPTSQAGY